MIVYDISATISPAMAVYKNRPEKRPRLEITRDFGEHGLRESRLCLDMHTGTHLDMPLHVIRGGSSVENWNPEQCLSPCTVLDFSALGSGAITASALQGKAAEMPDVPDLFGPGRSVLLKTKNSHDDNFDFNFAYLEEGGATFLAGLKVAGVGIDALGIERDQPGHPTHRALLAGGTWILEGLRLAAVPQGEYTLVLAPLKIEGAEAAPARAFLLATGSSGDCRGK